jgi:RimJ/RimL family protein N-acetyltransferase
MHSLIAHLPACTQGTTVRLLQASDLERFHAYRSDAVLARYQGWTPMNLDDAQKFLHEMAAISALRHGGWIQLGIAETTSNALIGDVGLYLETDESTAEIGFTLCQHAQGHGHAKRAIESCLLLVFGITCADHVRAVTDTRNTNSIRTLERANFVKVAEQQSDFKGEQCSEFVYVYRRA